jgi:hypothetical protein
MRDTAQPIIHVGARAQCDRGLGGGYFDATRYQDDSGMVHGCTTERKSTPRQANLAAAHLQLIAPQIAPIYDCTSGVHRLS